MFKEFKTNTRRIVSSVFDFLDVDRAFTPVIEKNHNRFVLPKNRWSRYFYHIKGIRKLSKIVFSESSLKKISDTVFKSEKPTLKSKTEAYLRSVYIEDIRRLEVLIKKDLNNWLS
jgi:hypothetical protein